MEHEALLTSTEFAQAIGVSTVTLARWEKAGILLPHLKTPTGRRKYTPSQVSEYIEQYQMKEG